MLHPRHRENCFEFFATPQQTATILLHVPPAPLAILEHAAAQTGRTWNDLVVYALEVCRAEQVPDFNDMRTAEDWRTLLAPCQFRFSESEAWCSCTVLWKRIRRQEGDA